MLFRSLFFIICFPVTIYKVEEGFKKFNLHYYSFNESVERFTQLEDSLKEKYDEKEKSLESNYEEKLSKLKEEYNTYKLKIEEEKIKLKKEKVIKDTAEFKRNIWGLGLFCVIGIGLIVWSVRW